jgi:hypothetical protein
MDRDKILAAVMPGGGHPVSWSIRLRDQFFIPLEMTAKTRTDMTPLRGAGQRGWYGAVSKEVRPPLPLDPVKLL